MEWLCNEHNLEKAALCEWCSRSICQDCINEADGKKYCTACSGRLPMHELGRTNRGIAARGKENIDPTLSPEAVEEGKKYAQQATATNKAESKGIKNTSGDTAEMRKKREEYEKMRTKFNI